MTYRTFGFAATVVAILTGAAGMAQAQQKPLELRIGWVQAPGHMAPVLYQNKAILPHFGKSYVAEPVRFQGTTPQVQAMAIKELEIASASGTSLVAAVENAHLDLRVVADVIQDGTPGYYTAPFIIRADSGIKTVQDLKGRRVATNAIGSAADAAMRIYLHGHGVQDSDFTTVEANFANMPAMLADGKVDMFNLQPQFAAGFYDPKKYPTLFTTADAIGRSQTVFWVMRADFIKEHRAQLVDYFEDHLRALRWFLDPANHKQAVDIAATALKATPASLDYAFTKNDYYRSPDAEPIIEAIQHDIDSSLKLGLIKTAIKVSPKYVDLSLISEAKKRIDK
jgi:sulfonate transport system substrate-binding protein